LNEAMLSDIFYDRKENESWYKTWNSFRLLAIDGSKLVLPTNKETKKEFWGIPVHNGKWEKGEYV
jgi:hypothetical protein